jgi:hypothetical protein
MLEQAKMVDKIVMEADYQRGEGDMEGIIGHGVAELRGPDGELKQVVEFKNLITDRGDEYYGKRGAGASETAATGMRLGTGGATAPSKNGAGSAIVTYTSGSNQALSGSPSVSDKGAGAGYRIEYAATWAAGTATANGINEVVITNESPLTNIAGAAANTIARGLLSPVVNKGAGDTLTVTWRHDFQGA